MDLKGIFTIGGKPGLQTLVAKSPNGVIVESLTDGKRFNAYSSYKISSLEDISIYGEEDDLPLKEVLIKIAEGNDFSEMEVPVKAELVSTLNGFIPIDTERVYESDIKKLFSWYNILIKNSILIKEPVKKEIIEEDKEEVTAVDKEKDSETK